MPGSRSTPHGEDIFLGTLALCSRGFIAQVLSGLEARGARNDWMCQQQQHGQHCSWSTSSSFVAVCACRGWVPWAVWKERVAAVQLARAPSAWRCGADLLRNACALRNKVMQQSFRSLACGYGWWFASPARIPATIGFRVACEQGSQREGVKSVNP